MIYKKTKSIIDKFFAFILLIFFTPVYLIVGILIYLDLGFPILFVQKRPGYKNKLFNIYKFRTMRIKFGDDGRLLSDVKRTSRIGNILRNYSIDELPQLLNILLGDMSFIGPRPLLTEYLTLYDEKQITRHNVKPGLTCLSQINGRNSITWEQKFDYDIDYVNNYSFLMDLKILFLTIWKVLKKEGVNSSKNITMDKFRGN